MTTAPDNPTPAGAALLVDPWQPPTAAGLDIVAAALDRFDRVVAGICETDVNCLHPYTMRQRQTLLAETFPAEVADRRLITLNLRADVGFVVHGRKVGWDFVPLRLPTGREPTPGVAALMIGRWQPLHDGHKALIQTALNRFSQVVVGLRNCKPSEDNPYSIAEREVMLREAFPAEIAAGDLVMLDLEADILHVAYGEPRAWTPVELSLSADIEKISGTAIRQAANQGKDAR